MKVLRISTLIVISLFFENLTPAKPKLLAPVYPGSLLSPLRGDKTESVFLSKDPVKKIESFYNAKIGRLSKKDPLTQSNFLDEFGNTPILCYGKTVITANQISRQEGYPDPNAKDAGVLLIVKKLPQQSTGSSTPEAPNSSAENTGTGDTMQAKTEQLQRQIMQMTGKQKYSKTDVAVAGMSPLFDGLKNEVLMNRHSKKELLNVYKKFKYLDASFYLLVKDKQGNQISYANYLLKQYQNKLGNRGITSDQWKYWMGFLKKLAAHAYKTCIAINTEPSSWNH